MFVNKYTNTPSENHQPCRQIGGALGGGKLDFSCLNPSPNLLTVASEPNVLKTRDLKL